MKYIIMPLLKIIFILIWGSFWGAVHIIGYLWHFKPIKYYFLSGDLIADRDYITPKDFFLNA